jgi:hypothetical protein
VESIVTAAAAEQPPAAGQAFDKTTMLTVPPVSTELGISCWVKIRSIGNDANYILSKGEWSQAYSLGLSGGYPRLAIGKTSEWNSRKSP